tara:strand:+ start:65 stop:457 length:393 start_codon:yes stop_codon:yes gene_type:complete
MRGEPGCGILQGEEGSMPAAKRDKNGKIIYKRDKNGKILRYKDGRAKVVRNYRKEYDGYHGTSEQKKNRASRNKARRRINASRKARGQAPLRKNQEVDHKKPLSKGGGNGKSNTRVVSFAANRRKYNKSK